MHIVSSVESFPNREESQLEITQQTHTTQTDTPESLTFNHPTKNPNQIDDSFYLPLKYCMIFTIDPKKGVSFFVLTSFSIVVSSCRELNGRCQATEILHFSLVICVFASAEIQV